MDYLALIKLIFLRTNSQAVG